MKHLFSLLLLIPISLFAEVIIPSSNGRYELEKIEKATRGGVIVSRSKNITNTLRLVCVEKFDEADDCKSYNFFISSERVADSDINQDSESKIIQGRLIHFLPVSYQALESRREMRKLLRKNANNKMREIHYGYLLPGTVAIYPIIYAILAEDPIYLLLLPVSLPIGAVMLPPAMAVFSFREISTQTKFNRYLRSVVNEKDRVIRMRDSSFESLRDTFLRLHSSWEEIPANENIFKSLLR